MPRVARPESVIREKRRDLRRPRDPNSLVASAAIMTGPNRSKAKLEVKEWQALAWSFYDDIGELRFGVNWLANALSRVNLVAAIPAVQQGDEPTPIDLDTDPGLARQVELVSQIAGGVAGQGQLLAGATRQLTVPGLGYILAVADELDRFVEWRVLSNEEAKKSQGSSDPNDPGIEVTNSETGDWEPIKATDLLIKVWRAHPRKSWEPDSPVRSALTALNEIRLMSMRVAADAGSRLTGAGLLIMPEEAQFPAGQTGNENQVDADSDEFIQTFVQVSSIATQDQESPAAKVPLVVTMPGEFVQHVQHLTFWSEFDAETNNLRDAAVKRLAISLDMAPETLTGKGETNHWSAWQIAEEDVTMQIEPLAETICHALTVGYLQPALEGEGLDKDSAIVWYDTTDLTTRPDLTAAATEAHKERVISDDAYLGYVGLNVDDKPDEAEFRRRTLIDIAIAAPALASELLLLAGVITQAEADGLDEAQQASTLPGGGSQPPSDGSEPAADGPPVEDTTPPEDDQGPPDSQAASGLLAATDGLVVRALERAGSRLRSAAGRSKGGGSASVPCDDPVTLHCAMSATQYASLDSLLGGAWDRVPQVAQRFGVGAESLHACLDGYTRALLASGHAHDYDLLAAALGVIDDSHRRLVAAH